MIQLLRLSWLGCCLLLLAFAGHAQEHPNRKATFFSSDAQEKLQINGEPIVKHTGNVVLKQPDKTLYCNEVIEYQARGMVYFIGNVRIVQNTGSRISGDTLIYYKDDRLSNMRGNVVVRDKESVLTTTELDYNMDNGLAFYRKGATMVDGKNTLTSIYGEFDRVSHIMYFRNQVHLKGENSKLDTDTLRYNTETKMAFFYGNTTIVNKDGTLNAKRGQYNTRTEQAKFDNRANIETTDYIMTGDEVDYDKEAQYGTSAGNVVLFSERDSITIYGDQAEYSGLKHFSKVYGKARLKDPVSGQKGDTLFLAADTLLSLNTNDKLKRKILAFHKVRIFKNDIQGIADSLVYASEDSTIRFFKDPVLWNRGNQLTADSIWVELANRKIDKLRMRQNAFVISEDTLHNFNQLKGRNMVANFANSKLKQIDVDGNGQSIYFALEGDTVLSGMNKVICSNMIIRFAEVNGQNKLQTMTFIKQPDAVFIPPHELAEPERRLKGFKWRKENRPEKVDVTGQKKAVLPPGTPPPPPPKLKKAARKLPPIKKTEKSSGKR